MLRFVHCRSITFARRNVGSVQKSRYKMHVNENANLAYTAGRRHRSGKRQRMEGVEQKA